MPIEKPAPVISFRQCDGGFDATGYRRQLSHVAFRTRETTVLFLSARLRLAWTFWLAVSGIVRHSALGAGSDSFAIPAFIAGAFGPTVAALVTRWLAHRDLKIGSLWTGWRGLIAGLAVGVLGFLLATVAAPSLALVREQLFGLHWGALAHGSTYAVNYSTFLGGPVNEEPGWRGFALPRLQQRYGPFWATVILAPLWAGWHLPLFQVPGWSTASPWQFVLILLGASFLLTATANLSRFNIVVAILLHAFLNTSTAMVNALTHNLPPRPYPMVSYSLAVFSFGTLFGLVVLSVLRPSRE